MRTPSLMSVVVLVYSFFVAAPNSAVAACHVIVSGGRGDKTGSDWNNALPDLPAALTRGDVYYIAAGTYGSHSFNDTDNGSVISVKGATASDHCADSGWSASYAVGGSQAALWNNADLEFDTGHYVFDGNAGMGAPGVHLGTAKAGYGFHIVNTSSGGYFINITGSNTGNITIAHTEFDGVTAERPDTFNVQAAVNATTGNGLQAITVQYNYMHDVAGVFFYPISVSNVVWQYNYMARNRSTPAQHAEFVSSRGPYSNHTYRWNIFEDVEGTGVFVCNSGTCTNVSFYGNVVEHVPSNANYDGGIVAVDNSSGGKWAGLNFYNNTIYNLTGDSCRVYNTDGSTGTVVKNNLWVNCPDVIEDGAVSYNTMYNDDLYGYGQSLQTGEYCSLSGGSIYGRSCTSSNQPSPFINAAALDFRLANETSFHVADGNSTHTAFPGNDVDMLGTPRGTSGNWDRGAYQFSGSSSSSVNPPSGLQAVVQ